MARLILHYFSTLSHKHYDFFLKKKRLLDIKCAFWFLYNFVCNTSHPKKNSAWYVQKSVLVCMQSNRYSWQIFIDTWVFVTDFQKMLKYPIFMKFHLVRVELFHADRQTHVTKLLVASRNFSNAPKNSTLCTRTKFMRCVSVSEQTVVIPYTVLTILFYNSDGRSLLRHTRWNFKYGDC